jgi:ClpP class serine protease
VNDIAQGRVWTGDQALKLKLIDKLGGFDVALAEARRLANLDPDQEVKLEELPEQQGPLTRLLSGQVYDAIYDLALARFNRELVSQAGGAAARAFAPMLAIMRDAGTHHAGEVYCPVVPMM